MVENKINQDFWNKKSKQSNECPEKDEDGNCLVPGVFSDSEEIGGA